MNPATAIQPHPNFELYTATELKQAVNDLEENIRLARDIKDEENLTWLVQEKRLALAALAHRNGNGSAKSQASFWPELISAKQLLALPPDPTRWIWDRTLPVGGCSVLVSKPKIGKSTFAATLSICVARGLPFLDRDTQQAAVAYLSLDASLPEIAEVFTNLGLRETDPVFIHAGAAPKDAVGWIMQRVTDNSVRFVIVDTLQRLFRFQDLNDYSQVTNTMEPLLEAMRKHGCHVQFLHHAKKDAGDDLDSAIGSTAIRGLAYAYLHLKRLPESERRILRSDQRGGKNFSELAIGFNHDGWLEVQGTRENAEVDDTRPKIRAVLEVAEESMTEKEIRAAVPARGIIVSKAIRELFKADEVTRTGRGKKGDPFRYSLAAGLFEKPEKPSGFSSDSSSSLLLSSSSHRKPESAKNAGHESNGHEKSLADSENRDTNGIRRDTNPENEFSGHESLKDSALRIFGGKIQEIRSKHG